MGSAGLSRRGERRLVEVKRVGGLSVKALMRSSVVAEAQVVGHAEFGPGDAVVGVWHVERPPRLGSTASASMQRSAARRLDTR